MSSSPWGATGSARGRALAAALIVVTRVPVLDFGARAYVDIPFIALVLAAMLVETRRPRAGWPVLALLAAAGLLRPEAWLFSFAYVGWLAWETRRFDPVFLIALVAPVGWMLHDLLVPAIRCTLARHPRERQELNRITGIDHVPTTMPRRLGEILRESGLLAAAIGGVLAVAWRRGERGVRIGVAAGVVAVVAFCILAAGGLPIRTRYLMLTACILAVFAGAGLFGWMTVDDRRHRRWWAWLSAVALLAVLVTAPNQVDRIRSLRAALSTQVGSRTRSARPSSGAVRAVCGPKPPAGAARRALARRDAGLGRRRAGRLPGERQLRLPAQTRGRARLHPRPERPATSASRRRRRGGASCPDRATGGWPRDARAPRPGSVQAMQPVRQSPG